MNLELEERLALVTGSTAGIGLAIAAALSAEGARVIVNGRTPERVAAAMEAILAVHPEALLEGFAADLADPDSEFNILEEFPRLDILVNNLGVYEPKPFEEISDDDWFEIIDVNFMSGVRLCRDYLPRMKETGWGRVIFISSESAVNIPMEMIHYGVTKTMQLALARGLAETTVGTGVTVNSILAGPTLSEGVERLIGEVAEAQEQSPEEAEMEFFQTMRPSSLLQRFASTDEIASLVAYVASPRSSATNGAALRADGGVIRSIL